MASKVSSAVQKKKRSREAARQRRGQQNDEFSVLAAQLPLLPNVSCQLDRLCVMKLTNSFIKTKHISKSIMDQHCSSHIKTEDTYADLEASMIQALGGFILVIAEDGHCVYVSPNVMQFLGLPQLEMVGDSIYKYIHPCDQAELAKQLGGQVPLEDMEIFDGLFTGDTDSSVMPLPKKVDVAKKSSPYRSIFLRMKSTITSRGKSVNLNASIFRVVHCMGTILPFQTKCKVSSGDKMTNCLLAVGTPLLCQATFEVPLDRQTFTTKHSLDMKVIFCDDRTKELLGYHDSDIVGKSWYSMGHVCDIDVVKSCHNTIMGKGQAISGYYRVMNKSGGWLWMQTKGSMVYSSTTCQPQYILCINHVISGVEGEQNILSTEQTVSPATKRLSPTDDCPLPGKKCCMDVVDCPMPVCSSGMEEIAALVNHEEEYKNALADFYDSMPLPDLDCSGTTNNEMDDNDDFDDDLPSLEFLDGDEYVPLDDCRDDLMNDEEFLLRAPFIPPPPVDEVLTDFPLDESFLNDVADEDNVDDLVLAARAPFIPPPCIDTLLTFDEIGEFDDLDTPIATTSSDSSPFFDSINGSSDDRRVCTTPPMRLIDVGAAAVPADMIDLSNRKRKADDELHMTKITDSKCGNDIIPSKGKMPFNGRQQKMARNSSGQLLPLITNSDAEMNAPSYSLLQGGDLFSALDQLYCPRLR